MDCFFTERTLINWGNYRWGFSCNTKMGRKGWEEVGVWAGDVGIPWIGEGWKHPQWSWWEAATCLGSITAVVAATGSSSCLCWFLFVAPLVPQDCTGDLNMVQGNGNLWSALWFASFCGVRQFGDLGELGSSEYLVVRSEESTEGTRQELVIHSPWPSCSVGKNSNKGAILSSS